MSLLIIIREQNPEFMDETLSTQIDGKKKERKSTSCCWKYSPLERATSYVHIENA
jgi:hypothetical protein